MNYHTKDIANTVHPSTGSNCNTCQYVLEPKPIVLGNKYPSAHACGKIYHMGGVSPTVMDNHGETVTVAEPYMRGREIEESTVLTPKRTEDGKRLRKDYENHKIAMKRKYMQQLEPRTDGVSNTLTSVQKDNLLVEPRLRIKANTEQGYAEVGEYGALDIAQPSSSTRRGRVQGENGDICGAFLTGQEKAVIEPLASVRPLSHAAEFNGKLSDVSPCLRATEAKAVTCAWEPSEEVRQVAEEVRHQPCGVTIDGENNLRPHRLDKAKSCVAELQTEYDGSVASTLTAARPNNVYGITTDFRIRRLIPRECFRLMDVSDEDYDKIDNYVRGYRKNGTPMKISESQQYKLAGNSIVVACMEHIFENLFFPTQEQGITEPKQLNIFDII